MQHEALAAAVNRFLDDVTPAVEELAGSVPAIRADRLAGDVALEAFDVTAAFIDADGLHTDNELWALIATFGPLLETQLGHAAPADVRKAGLVTGRRRWTEQPSTLFDILLKADRRNGTSHAWTYYERAMALAHAVGTTDVHVSHLELTQIERFRTMLLTAIHEHGIARPGPGPTTPAAAGGPETPSASGAPADVSMAPPRSIEDLFEELDGLIGLDAVKAEVKLVANLIQVQRLRRDRGMPVPDASRHLVFTGNPGTGKTTVARLLAQIYRTLEVVDRGHLVETDRSGLVAGYVGQTALRVKEVFTTALGGVLLVDEAYALARGGERDFGMEAVDTLVKLIEDHRDEIVVIMAGYPAEMATLVDSNPGMRSRFPRTIHFPDYTDEELVAIFRTLCRKSHYEPDEGALAAARARFAAEPRGKGFGNGRLARNLFEAAMATHASRVVTIDEPTDAQLCAITAADVEAAGATV